MPRPYIRNSDRRRLRHTQRLRFERQRFHRDNDIFGVRSIVHDTELPGTAPDLGAFVVRAFYGNARKVPARGSRQSRVLEVSRDVPDVAWIDGSGLHLNECFAFAGLRNRDFFDSQHRWRSKLGKTQRFHYVGTLLRHRLQCFRDLFVYVRRHSRICCRIEPILTSVTLRNCMRLAAAEVPWQAGRAGSPPSRMNELDKLEFDEESREGPSGVTMTT
jgi:hypothetical protein